MFLLFDYRKVIIVIMKKIIELYKKYRELIVYVICGGLTTAVSFAFQAHGRILFAGDNFTELRTAISWVAAVLFAFFVNKFFVFNDTEKEKHESEKRVAGRSFMQFVSFVSMRLLSLGIEMIIMSFGVRVLHLNDFIPKIFAQVIVVISNYFFSKFIIFAKKR